MTLIGGEANGGAGNAAPGTGGSAGTGTADGGKSSGTNSTAQGGGTGNAPGAGGGAAASWRDTLPDDIKSDPTLSKFSDVGNLSKAYIELQKKIGQKGIIKPGPNASPEEKKAFFEALGVPPEDKYTIGEIKDAKFPTESLEWARKTGAKLGVLPETMTEMLQEFGKFDSERATAASKKFQDQVKEGLDGLKKEWGEAYDTQVKRADFAAKQLGDTFHQFLGKSGLGNNPTIIKAMADVAKLYGEDKLREGNVGDGRQTPEQIQNELTSVRAQLITMDKNNGMRPVLLQKLESLSKQATGGR